MDHSSMKEESGRDYWPIDMPSAPDPSSSIETKNRRHSNPEKKLTIVALWLAALEKAATGFGTLGFIWATVVLLGGFAITLGKTDFWFITIILIIEGARIFSRSHELEWQQRQATNSFCCGPINVVQKQHQKLKKTCTFRQRKCDGETMLPRAWEMSDVPVRSFSQWVFLPKNVSKVLSWLQLAFATACAVLSLMKLIEHNYGEVEKGATYKRNRIAALIIFYSLALAEALMFLLEKAYWQWKVIHCKVLEEVNKECDLGPSGEVFIRRFFYDAYSRNIHGSIFDGLKMDMVSHAVDLLASNLLDEQLIGIGTLQQFVTKERFSDNTFKKIGTTLPVMERLFEMLNWRDLEEQDIRQSAAKILSKLASQKQYARQVSGIPGAMESISSLLQNHWMSHGVVDEKAEKIINHKRTLAHSGLLILKKLARDHGNCGKIGNTRGVLHKIIRFTRLLKDENLKPSKITTVKRSLQVLKVLASTTGSTGKQLRHEISEIVFTISNIRDILKYGKRQTESQILGINILTSLANEAEAKERIGATHGVLKELFNIFFKEGMPANQKDVRIAAGEALTKLASESKSNCCRILEMKVFEKLVKALEVPLLRINAEQILKKLCIYVRADCFMQQRGVINAAPVVLRAIMSEKNQVQEMMAGLAAHVFKFMPSEESSIIFERAGIQEAELAEALVQTLRKYQKPAVKTPRIRRFVIELAIWMMTHKETNVQRFKDLGMKKDMESVIETTSDLENFSSFFGGVGMSRHSKTIHSLVVTAMKLMEDRQ